MLNNLPKLTLLVFINMIYTQNSLLLKKTYEKFNISQVLNILKFSFKFKYLIKFLVKFSSHRLICRQRPISIMVKKKNYVAYKEMQNIPV